jgi:prepilin-type N-terminal cleavage/methylation domain-containing protein
MFKKLFNKFRKQGSEKGFTLLELVVSLSILGFVTTGLSLTIDTIFKTSSVAANETQSMRQVQTAGYWITRDIQRGVSISTAVSGRFLDLDYYDGTGWTHTAHVYYVINNGQMTRYLSDGSSLPIAQDIISAGTSITSDNSTGTVKWTLNIAVSNGATENRTATYLIEPRVQ